VAAGHFVPVSHEPALTADRVGSAGAPLRTEAEGDPQERFSAARDYLDREHSSVTSRFDSGASNHGWSP
jgi:hypothetical protein